MPENPLQARNPQALLQKLKAQWDTNISPGIKKSLDEISGLVLFLPTNPSNKSLANLFDSLSKAREYTNRVGTVYLEALKLLSRINHLKKESDRRLDLEIALLLKDHPEHFANCRGADEKRLVASSLIDPHERELNAALEDMLDSSKNYFSFVQHKHEELSSFKQETLTQLGIVKSMIVLGELHLDADAVRAIRLLEVDARPPSPHKARATIEAKPILKEGDVTL